MLSGAAAGLVFHARRRPLAGALRRGSATAERPTTVQEAQLVLGISVSRTATAVAAVAFAGSITACTALHRNG